MSDLLLEAAGHFLDSYLCHHSDIPYGKACGKWEKKFGHGMECLFI